MKRLSPREYTASSILSTAISATVRPNKVGFAPCQTRFYIRLLSIGSQLVEEHRLNIQRTLDGETCAETGLAYQPAEQIEIGIR
jgi:hypothetical protein